MTRALWAIIGGVAILWPARLAGPLDGAPLDAALEAAALVAIVLIVWLHPRLLSNRTARSLVIALLAWKAITAASVAQDGWCLRFTSPVALYRDTGQVPHSWDVRADWRTPNPSCSAVMTRGYDVLEEFPVWFYNLPPVAYGQPAEKTDRPPLVTLRLDLHGFLHAERPGTFQLVVGEHVDTLVNIGGTDFTPEQVVKGVAVPAGTHRVAIRGDLRASHWSLKPLWNGQNLWSATTATMTAPSTLDLWLRPWGRLVSALLMAGLIGLGLWSIAARIANAWVLGATAILAALMASFPLLDSAPATRLAPLLLAGAALAPWPRRLRNGLGASLILGVPFAAWLVVMGLPQVGLFTWYSSGDDWWMFQRYAYGIFMEGYWLEGGQETFWFQPLYRWIAGSLHMIFGDSSVGELWWDGACLGIGAFFAFHITRRFASFRWGALAAATTIAIFTLGPPWYLLGRGLSEMSSMGFIYGAALCALRARRGEALWMLLCVLLCALAFYTRLNNLPMVCAVAVFAFSARQPVGGLFSPRVWLNRASRPALVAVFGGVALALWLFTWRTWYYTGHIDLFYGTQAADRAMWKPGDGVWLGLRRIVGSLAMVLSMNDPPRLDIRAIPIFGGVVAAALGALRVPRLSSLPLNVSALCLAGLTGAIVARGSAYPGRFSIHMIPASVAVFMCALSLFVRLGRQPKSAPPAHQPPGTT